jgi:hypothetical protein
MNIAMADALMAIFGFKRKKKRRNASCRIDFSPSWRSIPEANKKANKKRRKR